MNDYKGFLTGILDNLSDQSIKRLCSLAQYLYSYVDSGTDQRKSEIILMIDRIEDRQCIDMIYGFVRRLYKERDIYGQQ